MDRSIKTGRKNSPRLALAVTTAIAGLAFVGTPASAAPRAETSFANAQEALAKGKVEKAIKHAEAAVQADGRNSGYRALLGAAYLEAGRFEAAAITFGDAIELGDSNPRTVLSFALAKIAIGDSQAAIGMLDGYSAAIDPADLGLALALAGQPERGVGVLVGAVRSAEEATPKLRQNLAYTYALAGNWRAARVMAAEDVPADQLETRLGEWAQMSAPEMAPQRVAALLDVAPRADAGQPQHLALANFLAQDMMVAEADVDADVALAAAEPAPEPVQVIDPAPSATFTAAFTAPAPAPEAATEQPIVTFAAAAPVATGIQFVSNPVVQPLPAAAPAAVRAPVPPAAPRVVPAASQRRMAATTAAAAPAPAPVEKGPATHLVQLGSYVSKAEAQRGWSTLQAKFPQLKDRKPVITEAVVSGKTYWRVAADGFTSQSARALCGTVKSAGRGCFAYAASTPPAGAVKRDVQVATRSR
ncbi:MAG: SPOR domain-containing protein [Erythrobacter sp.]|uniref:SPOR domain-containing protein n=1 Tax=Erythrobacter sp. TaxID=1042 RepID=UPI0025F7C09B|nr:SPOR domain-containing protein [Erythrobacter sp.]MCL9998129.1 SPOR domain-containing protein [Erythrobacter sp.]